MITREQIKTLVKKFKINETTIFREYLQLLFLNSLYSFTESRKSCFLKGGTAAHFDFQSPPVFPKILILRLNFSQKRFFISNKKGFLMSFPSRKKWEFKERKTITSKRFLMTASPSILPYKSFC